MEDQLKFCLTMVQLMEIKIKTLSPIDGVIVEK